MDLKKRLSYRWRLFIPIVGMMWFIVAVLMVYQYKREVSYRTNNIHKQLAFINSRILDAYETDTDLTPFMNFVGQYYENSIFDEIMISVYNKDGELIYNVGQPLVMDFSETNLPDELRETKENGIGTFPGAQGESMFYFTARKSKDGQLYVRTAMPYTVTISDAISAEPDFWIIIIVLTILVTVMAYYSTVFLTRNVTLLRDFANTVGEGGTFVDENKFPHDELGEISRQIIKLYREKDVAIKESEKEHQIALHAVEEKARIKRQLTNNINHELKTPIGIIKGYLDTILGTPDMDEATRDRFLIRMHENMERLGSLLSDVSSITRLEEGSGNIPVTEVDMHDLVYTIQHDISVSGIAGNMKFRYDVPLSCRVRGNSTLLNGLVTNLIKNAAQHSHGTEMGLRLISESPRFYTFCFYDNGVGVSDEHLSRLFERFYRIDAGRSRNSGGTGLGLPIVKSTVEALGGSISVRNRSTGGLEFVFTLEKWSSSDK